MKVKFRNLGVIKEAEVDLKPLTIFVGPNNAGKTWLAYALAGILGSYGLLEYLRAYQENKVPRAYSPLEKAIKQVKTHGSAAIDLVQFAKEYGEVYFNNVAHFAQQWMPKYMSTHVVPFENLDVSMDLAEAKKEILQRLSNYTLRFEIPGGTQNPSFSMRKKRGESKLYIYTSIGYASSEDISLEEQITEPIPSDVMEEYLIFHVLRALHMALYPYVWTLPTERTTFITVPFIEALPSQEQKTKTMIGPVNSFLSMIKAAFKEKLGEKEQREKSAKNNPKIREYIRLAELLEQQILGGEVKFSQTEPDSSQEIPQSELDLAQEVLFQPTEGSKLEIAIASSMVKELSPLVLYLRYFARPGELLVIDEPEMNLHPEAQVKMMELLAMLINAGLNVLVTTHSPYLVDHLANLIKADEAEDRESIRSEFYLRQTEAFISKDKVSVYLVDQGHTTRVMDEDGVIELSTFGDVADRISEIYFKL